MGLLGGRRYGEPDFQASGGTSFLHTDDHPAMGSTASYEEARLGKHWQSPAALKGVVSVPDFAALADKTDVVKIIVGTSPEKTWVVHEHLLTSVSHFAKAALTLPFKEKEEKTIRLPEGDPTVFEVFVKFVYTSAIDVPSLDMILQLYVLGDQMQAITLCERIHAGLAGLFDKFTEAQLEYVLENTAPGDRLRRSCILALGVVIRCSFLFPFSHEFARTLCEKYASEILADMMYKYNAIILEPAKMDGSSAKTLLNPEMFASFREQLGSKSSGTSFAYPGLFSSTKSSVGNPTNRLFGAPSTAQTHSTNPLGQTAHTSASSVFPTFGTTAPIASANNTSALGANPVSLLSTTAGSQISGPLDSASTTNPGLFHVPASSTTLALSQSIFGPHSQVQSTPGTVFSSTIPNTDSSEPSPGTTAGNATSTPITTSMESSAGSTVTAATAAIPSTQSPNPDDVVAAIQNINLTSTFT